MSKRKQESAEAASEMLVRNVPPHDLEAEQAVLGGVFLRPEILDELVGVLTGESFYSPAHKEIWLAMVELGREQIPVDLVSVANKLTERKSLDSTGGAVYLAELAGSTVSAANSLYHAQIVKSLSMRRAFIRIGARAIEVGFDRSQRVEDFAGYALKMVDRALQDRVDLGGQTTEQMVDEYLEYLSRLQETGGDAIPVPFAKLRSLLVGLFPGELTYIGARPSNGKTALAVKFVSHALDRGHACGIFSMEMIKEKILNRMFSARAQVQAQRFRDGEFSDDDWGSLKYQAKLLRGLPLRIHDRPVVRPGEIIAQCRRWQREMGLELAVVDYAQLVAPESTDVQRERQVAEASRMFKLAALDMRIHFLVLSQLSREAEKTSVPLISHLRESGALEQDADNIILIKFWQPNSEKIDDVLEVTSYLAKGRDNATGKFLTYFRRKYVEFVDRAREYEGEEW